MRKIPHMFSKIVVWWCIICATLFSVASLFVLVKTGNDPSATLGVIMAFFGGELLFVALKRIFQDKGVK